MSRVKTSALLIFFLATGLATHASGQNKEPEPAASTSPSPEAPADDEAKAKTAPKIETNMSYDAKSVGINKELNRSVFDGDVVALGGGTVIMADHVETDSVKNEMEARGHIIVIAAGQLFIGDTLTYHWLTGDFRITEATMVVNDSAEAAKISNHLLGFTPEELAFEALKNKRLSYLSGRRDEMRREYRKTARFGEEPDPNLSIATYYCGSKRS